MYRMGQIKGHKKSLFPETVLHLTKDTFLTRVCVHVKSSHSNMYTAQQYRYILYLSTSHITWLVYTMP